MLNSHTINCTYRIGASIARIDYTIIIVIFIFKSIFTTILVEICVQIRWPICSAFGHESARSVTVIVVIRIFKHIVHPSESWSVTVPEDQSILPLSHKSEPSTTPSLSSSLSSKSLQPSPSKSFPAPIIPNGQRSFGSERPSLSSSRSSSVESLHPSLSWSVMNQIPSSFLLSDPSNRISPQFRHYRRRHHKHHHLNLDHVRLTRIVCIWTIIIVPTLSPSLSGMKYLNSSSEPYSESKPPSGDEDCGNWR